MSNKKCKASGCSNIAIYESGYCSKHQKEFEKMVGKENIIEGDKEKLVKCPACGKEISSEAEICINCGHPISKKEKEVSKKEKTIRCPNCNSSYVKKISKKSKVKSGLLLGIFALGKISKAYKCKNCGYRW
jgi:DNA-directed RNA polymerase subunit RPC12/RpoP